MDFPVWFGLDWLEIDWWWKHSDMKPLDWILLELTVIWLVIICNSLNWVSFFRKDDEGSVGQSSPQISRTSISCSLLIKYLCCFLKWTGLKIVPAQTQSHYSLDCRPNVSFSKAHRYKAIHSYSASRCLLHSDHGDRGYFFLSVQKAGAICFPCEEWLSNEVVGNEASARPAGAFLHSRVIERKNLPVSAK